MRRLIISRGAKLALAATALAAIIAIIMRFRRSPTRQDPASHNDAPAESPSPPRAESEPVSQWPPAPILGVPTAKDLKHYAVKPSAFRTALESGFSSPPRERLDDATRRSLNRWGIAALVLLLVVGGTQALESAVFSQGAGTETSEPAPDR